MEVLSKKLKDELISNLSKGDLDIPYIFISKKSYSKKELIIELKNETKVGIKLLSNTLTLTIDLLSRNKETLNNKNEY